MEEGQPQLLLVCSDLFVISDSRNIVANVRAWVSNEPVAGDDKGYFLQILAPSIVFRNNGEKWNVFSKSVILWHGLFAFPSEEALRNTKT